MAKKKLGIGNIEINKKFKNKEEAYRYAKRLIEYIRCISKKNADKGWYAQAMVVSSNLKKDVSTLRYEITGKRGRPRKKIILIISSLIAGIKGIIKRIGICIYCWLANQVICLEI